MNDARTDEMMMLMTRFATHFHPENVVVTITYTDDERIIATIIRDDARVMTYTFEITSDDDAYVFVNDDDASDVITYEIPTDD